MKKKLTEEEKKEIIKMIEIAERTGWRRYDTKFIPIDVSVWRVMLDERDMKYKVTGPHRAIAMAIRTSHISYKVQAEVEVDEEEGMEWWYWPDHGGGFPSDSAPSRDISLMVTDCSVVWDPLGEWVFFTEEEAKYQVIKMEEERKREQEKKKQPL